MSDYLKSKNFKYFNPKSKLIQLVFEVEEHIDSLEFEIECDVMEVTVKIHLIHLERLVISLIVLFTMLVSDVFYLIIMII